MVKFFQAFGYVVGDTSGKHHIIINIFSLLSGVAYIYFSYNNLKASEPALEMFFINIANLISIILDNTKALLELSKTVDYSALLVRLFHASPIVAIKTVVEVSIVFIIAFLLLANNQQTIVFNSIIKSFAYLVLICILFEKIIDVVGNLFDVRLNLEKDS